jgi:ribokinase
MASPPDILVAGALHLDVVVDAPRLPRLDETLPGTRVAYPVGGKGANQAMAAARMGGRVAMAGAVGADAFGPRILSALDAAGVDRTGVAVLPGESGMSVAIVEASGGYGAVIVTGANARIDPAAVAVGPGLRLLVLQNEIPEAANLALAHRAVGVGARIILNAAPARNIATDLLRMTDLLVVNRVEAADLTAMPEDRLDPAGAAGALRRAGPRAVIVTLGADGLWLAADGAAPRHLPAFPVQAVSTHGAGDMFTGALAAALSRGAEIAQAARFGQAAAALHVAADPAQRSHITRARAEALTGG